jgi:redox-sensitive bicupin YhaK (pirin superfamily)
MLGTMSWQPATDPACTTGASSALATIIEGRQRDLGGFSVRRLLPSAERRLIGPFIFLDHIGPAAFPPHAGLDVRPHPHINLATVTYLFEGRIVHRDSLGCHQDIRPGELNWMTAGRGIVHSERSDPADREAGVKLHGMQAWTALPRDAEEIAPAFAHHPAEALPDFTDGGAHLRLIAGTAYGLTSPVPTASPLFYVEARLQGGAALLMPTDHPERAAYVVEGAVWCEGARFVPGQLLVFHPDVPAELRAEEPSRLMLLGGAPLDGPRHIWWNFVSSRPERIEQAKQDWRDGRFGTIPGDDQEFIPLPER